MPKRTNASIIPELRLGSLFSGSGGFELAGKLCGITPAWASEIEPYPIAVTRSRFPKMKHIGDVSKINGAEIEPVNVIIFGSPCQDLSIAGKRAGLKHEGSGDEETTRSGLFMEAVRIIKEMRRATNGRYPTFALWENVPGAFSSNKGEDFRTVLEEIVKIVEPTAKMPPMPKDGWAYADLYLGDGWSVAYRTFDAQYWGVPQRRRRIYLVADFGGQRAGKILFEREGLRRNFAESRTPRQRTPQNVERGAFAYDARGNGDGVTVNTITGDHENRITDYTTVVCLQDNGIERAETAGCSDKSWKEDTCYTLNTIDRPAVAYAMQYSGDDAKIPIIIDRAYFNQGVNTKYEPQFYTDGTYPTLVARGPAAVVTKYIVRRLTPTECARLQGFPDKWGHPDHKDDFTDEEYRFWLDVRNTHAAINGKAVKGYNKDQMLTWYNKLHTDSAEYKMWGNGIALPIALYVMQGIADELIKEKE